MSKETRDAAAEDRPSYKHTLNLLQTGFGMRANACLLYTSDAADD